MTRSQGKTGSVLGLVPVITVLAACSGSPPELSVRQPTTTTTTAPDAPSVATSSALPATASTMPTCDAPPRELVDLASVAIAAHPGTITATTYVFAATTDTGDWYVLGLDRTYVRDDGTPALGPEGEHSRSLALTNRARTSDGEVAMIPLSVAVSAKLPVSWDRVSWTGDTLAAGKRAAEQAMACLDEQGRP